MESVWKMTFYSQELINQICKRTPLESISSTFYSCVFCTKFWSQKLQSCVLGLKIFGAKILAKNVQKMLMKLTPQVSNIMWIAPNISSKSKCKLKPRGFPHLRFPEFCLELAEEWGRVHGLVVRVGLRLQSLLAAT